METIREQLKANRPSLSHASIKTYTSVLNSLYKNVFKDKENIDIKDFEAQKPILEYLESLPSNKNKTILSALYVLTEKPVYRELMLVHIDKYNITMKEQVKSDKLKANWITMDDIKDKLEELRNVANFIYKKNKYTTKDYQKLQNYILLALYSGIYIPPRRAEYTDFKIRGAIDKDRDNYLDKSYLVFNKYKTSKVYETQKVKLPVKLKTILNKWIAVNPTENLLFDNKNQPLNGAKLNQRINKIFEGKQVGVNGLRKSYLTEKYSHTIKLEKDMKEDFEKMGSSTLQKNHYIKK
jgi:hypothetical protein